MFRKQLHDRRRRIHGRSARNLLAIELLENRRVLSLSAMELPELDLPQLQVDTSAYDDTRILVRFRDDGVSGPADFDLPNDTEIVNSFEFFPELHEIEVAAGGNLHNTLKELRARPDVVYAEPDYRVSLQRVPNDPNFNRLWGMNNVGQTGGLVDADIDAAEAWDKVYGSGEIVASATPVIVAVIDTGVDYTHPDLASNMWTNLGEIPGNGRDDDQNGYVDDIHGYDFVNRDGDPMDDHFHGTHVAGTIGAIGDNGIGVAGVSWSVQIMALKFLSADGGGYTSDAIAALNYAVRNGAKVSNNSWGGGESSQALFEAIRAAGEQNHIFVAAAGNESNDNDRFAAYPASYNLPNIISVAALDHQDQLAYFSNFGTRSVDVGAPGVNIYSTFPTRMTDAMRYEGFQTHYETISGTSMATPHVAGLVSLVFEQHPDWSYEQVTTQIYETVDPVESLRRTATGGRINAAAAVGNPVPDVRGPRVVNSSPSGIVSREASSIKVTFSEPVSDFDSTDIVSFNGPPVQSGGPATNLLEAITSVTGSGREYTINFNTQRALGSYELLFGPDILDQSGNPMDQNANGNLGEVPGDQYRVRFTISEKVIYHSDDVPISIRDWSWSVSYLLVPQDILVGDVDVQLDITHSYTGDLVMYLVSPDDPDTYVPLAQYRGDSGQNFRATVFDDEAVQSIADGRAPFTGSFRPESPLSQFDGQNGRGYWELWIGDGGWQDEGQLNSWNLQINPGDGVITPVNRPPVANDDYAQTDEDTSVQVNVLANDRDRNADPLTVTAVSDVYGGRAVINSDKTITFTPDPNLNYYNGSAGFAYTISDGRGGTAAAWVWIDVVPVNDAPVAIDDVVQSSKNQTLVFSNYYGYYGYSGLSLEANDVDVDGDWLWVESVGRATNGTVRLESSGEVVFTPAADFMGTATFEYTVTDGTLKDTALVSIEIKDRYYFSTSTDGSLTNSDGSTTTFTSADIVQLSVDVAGNYQYSLFFDGSDVGLTTATENIDAFTIMSDGSILLSTTGAFSVTSYGYTLSGRGEDLLYFWPQTTGNDTSGYWNLYFDGSNVGLSGADENVDAVSVLQDGRIVISTAGPVRVPGVSSGADEDLLVFTPYSFGEGYTSGTWAMYFDGSDVGLGESDNEDVNGLYIRESLTGGQPTLFLTTVGTFDVPGLSGENEDIFSFTPSRLGGTTQGTYASSLTLSGDVYGLSEFDLDGIYVGQFIQPISNLPMSTGLSAEGEASVPFVFSTRTYAEAVDSVLDQLAPSLATNQPKVVGSSGQATRPTNLNSQGSASIRMNPAAIIAETLGSATLPGPGTDNKQHDDLFAAIGESTEISCPVSEFLQ